MLLETNEEGLKSLPRFITLPKPSCGALSALNLKVQEADYLKTGVIHRGANH